MLRQSSSASTLEAPLATPRCTAATSAPSRTVQRCGATGHRLLWARAAAIGNGDKTMNGVPPMPTAHKETTAMTGTPAIRASTAAAHALTLLMVDSVLVAATALTAAAGNPAHRRSLSPHVPRWAFRPDIRWQPQRGALPPCQQTVRPQIPLAIRPRIPQRSQAPRRQGCRHFHPRWCRPGCHRPPRPRRQLSVRRLLHQRPPLQLWCQPRRLEHVVVLRLQFSC